MANSIVFAGALILLLEVFKGLRHPKFVFDILPLGGSSFAQIGIILGGTIATTQILLLL